MIDLKWLDEAIGDIERPSLYYKFARRFFRRDLTYKDVYLITTGLLRKKNGEDKARELALNTVLKLYKKKHEGKLPEGIE